MTSNRQPKQQAKVTNADVPVLHDIPWWEGLGDGLTRLTIVACVLGAGFWFIASLDAGRLFNLVAGAIFGLAMWSWAMDYMASGPDEAELAARRDAHRAELAAWRAKERRHSWRYKLVVAIGLAVLVTLAVMFGPLIA